MADLIAGYKRIVSDRKFENYESMKKYFSSYYKKGIKEIIYCGWQLATAGAGVIPDGAQFTHGALISAEEIVYLATEADDNNQDGKSVWVIYQDDTGLIYTAVEHLLAAAAEATKRITSSAVKPLSITCVQNSPGVTAPITVADEDAVFTT